MNLLFYGKTEDRAGKRFQRMVESIVPKKERNVYQTIYDLSARLRRPTEEPAITVLLASSREDLLDILSIRELLCDTRVILILPDSEVGTVEKGHTLRPRFMTFSDNDFSEVVAVLGKML